MGRWPPANGGDGGFLLAAGAQIRGLVARIRRGRGWIWRVDAWAARAEPLAPHRWASPSPPLPLAATGARHRWPARVTMAALRWFRHPRAELCADMVPPAVDLWRRGYGGDEGQGVDAGAAVAAAGARAPARVWRRGCSSSPSSGSGHSAAAAAAVHADPAGTRRCGRRWRAGVA